MNVLFIAPFNLDIWDGTTIRVYNLAKAASKLSEHIYLVSPSINKVFLSLENLIWVKMKRLRRSYLLALGHFVMPQITNTILRMFIDAKDLEGNSADIIHVHWLSNIPIASTIITNLGVKSPILVDIHGSFTLQHPLPGSFRDILTIYLGRIYEYLTVKHREIVGITVPSKAFRTYLVKRYRLPSDYVYVVPDAIDLDLIEEYHGTMYHNKYFPKDLSIKVKEFKIIGYLGSTSYYHGFLDLLQAFIYVKKILPNVKLMLIVPRADEALNLAKKLGIKFDDIIVIENIPRSLVQKYLSITDVLVLPHKAGTQFEYLYSNKLLDYILSGKTIVAYALFPTKEILKDYPCKILVEPNKPLSLARGIINALLRPKNVELCKNISVSILPTINEVSKALKEVYQNIIRRSTFTHHVK